MKCIFSSILKHLRIKKVKYIINIDDAFHRICKLKFFYKELFLV